MWISKRQIAEFKSGWATLSEHIIKTNHELGVVQNDIKWLKWLVCAVFLAVSLGLIKQFIGV